MKVVIIGASAHSTPALFDTRVPLDASAFSFTLVARNRERLASVGRAITVLGETHGYRVQQQHASMVDLESAVGDANLIIVQIRAGGYASRHWDEQFPHRYGLPGDEGLGLGGAAAAWRTWPELRSILARIESARPQAIVLLLTSPVGILTRCALGTFPRLQLYGICELPWTTLNEMCDREGVDARDARFSYIGVNHVGWFSNVSAGDRLVLGPEDVLPLKYVALAEAGRAVREQRRHLSRARELEEVAAAAFRAYAGGSSSEIVAAVRRRATPWYAHAVAPFIAGFGGSETGATFFLTHRNGSYCEWLEDADVVEMPVTLRSSRLERGALNGWSRDDIAQQHTSLVRYEERAAGAVCARDPDRLASALGTHPWLRNVRIDEVMMRDVLAQPPAIDAPLTVAAAAR